MDLIEACYDEIALEGLDGITLNSLWYRLTRRRPAVSIRVDESSKSYYWNIIVSLQEVEFFCLPQERPDLSDVETVFDPDARLLVYKEHPFIKIYPFSPVSSDGLRGSCSTIKTRTNVTSQIRGNDYAPMLSLSQVVQRWGSKLVVVSSQRRRDMALLGPCADAATAVPLLEGMNYLYLEAIGRTRNDGLLGTDAFLHLHVPGKKRAQGRMFYHKKVLVSLGLILKQDYMVIKGGRYCNDNVCHLVRYYRPLKTFYIDLHDKLEEHLLGCPNHRDSKRAAFQAVDPDGKWVRFKRFIKERSEYFAKDHVPHSEFYPEASQNAEKGTPSKDKAVPCIRLIKRREEQAEDEEGELSDEEEETATDTDIVDIKQARLGCGEPMLEQLARYVHAQGPAGVSLQMIRQHFDLHTLMARNIVKAILQRKIFLSFFIDKGRQREQRFRTQEFKDITVSSANFHSVSLSQPAVATPVPVQITADKPTAVPTTSTLSQSHEPAVDTSSSSPDENLIATTESGSQPDDSSDVFAVPCQDAKGRETLGSAKKEITTSRMQERMDFIVHRVQEARVLTFCTIAKELKANESSRYKDQIDRRSLRRLIERLARDDKVKSYKTLVQVEGKAKELHYICEGGVTLEDRLLQSILEQERCQLLSSKMAIDHRLELKKKKEKLATEDPEPADFMQRHPIVVNICRTYGYQARLRRVEILHRFLWYLTYGYEGSTTPLPAVDNNSSESAVYLNEMSWKRYVAPLPEYPGFDRGWCLLADAVSNMPVSMFLHLVRIPYKIDGMLEVLADPLKAATLVRDLPQEMRCALMFRRHYATCIYQLVQLMSIMGLASFGKTTTPYKDMVYIYLHQNVSVKDTTSVPPGYAFCESPESLPIRLHQLTDENAMNEYWKHLQYVCLNTPLGYKQLNNKVEGPSADCYKTVISKAGLQYLFKPRMPAEIVDDGRIHGDGLGAAGLDSGMFCHRLANWVTGRLSVKYERASPEQRPAVIEEAFRSTSVLPVLSMSTTTTKAGRLAGLRTSEDKRLRLCTVTAYKKSLADMSLTAVQETVSMLETTVKAQRGGGAGQKRKLRTTGMNLAKKRKLPVGGEPQPTKRSRKRKLSISGLSPEELAAKKNKFDEVDMQALRNLKTLRAVWTPSEDVLLLLCKVGLMTLNVPRKFYPFRDVRDWLHKHNEASHDKSYKACHRRLLYLLKNVEAVRNVNLYLADALREEEILKYHRTKIKVRSEELTKAFVEVMALLLSKFKYQLPMQKQVVQLTDNLEELHSKYDLENPQFTEFKLPGDVTTADDLQTGVLSEIIVGYLLTRDKVGRTNEMRHVMSHYADQVPERVVTLMRSNGILTRQKIHARKRVHLPQIRYYDLSSLFHNTFILSSRFYKEHYLNTWDDYCSLIHRGLDELGNAVAVPNTDLSVAATTAGSLSVSQARCLVTATLLAQNKVTLECRLPGGSSGSGDSATDATKNASPMPATSTKPSGDQLPQLSYRPGSATQYLVMRRVKQALVDASAPDSVHEESAVQQLYPLATPARSILDPIRSRAADQRQPYQPYSGMPRAAEARRLAVGARATRGVSTLTAHRAARGASSNTRLACSDNSSALVATRGSSPCEIDDDDEDLDDGDDDDDDASHCGDKIGLRDPASQPATAAPEVADSNQALETNPLLQIGVEVKAKTGCTLLPNIARSNTSHGYRKAVPSEESKKILAALTKVVPHQDYEYLKCRDRLAGASMSAESIAVVDDIYMCVNESGELGIRADNLNDKFDHIPNLFEIIRSMIDYDMILRVGTVAFRYVTVGNADNWLAKSLRDTKGRGNVGYEVDSEPRAADPGCGDLRISTYEVRHFVPRLWRKPDGSLNIDALGNVLSSVLTFAMMSQGCSMMLLFEKFRGALSPVPLLELVEVLEHVGCLRLLNVRAQTKASLFSKMSAVSRTPTCASAATERTCLVTSVDCILRLGQFLEELGVRSSLTVM